ncbi:MAG: YHYH protein [Saprospiraceae bacterium]|nr:YHYH protein [Saprospiraceae bacterium]
MKYVLYAAIIPAIAALSIVGVKRGIALNKAAKINTDVPEDFADDTYTINLDPSTCAVDIEAKLGKRSVYEEVIDQKAKVRKVVINGVASHDVGAFPSRGNPNTIKEVKQSFSIPLEPAIAKQKTPGEGFDTGVLFSGVSIDPFTAEFFVGPTGAMNREWNITTLTSTVNLGLDCNNAHVQPTGKYHYHGTPSAYLAELDADGSEMVKVGYAADGFPIYYKYGYDEKGQLVAHQSGFQLKKGERPGNGKTAPDGPHNGRYFNDYEYVAGLTVLDECNGRWGKTPESENEYYYIITDNFPSVPLCFSGNPSQDFQKRRGGGPGDRRPRRGPRPPRPRH